MIRSSERKRQYVWLTRTSETRVGFDMVTTFSKPERYRLSLSVTKQLPYESKVGIIADYDRLVTAFGHELNADEGDRLFVDVEPLLDDDGELKLNDNGKPLTAPDYVITHKLVKQKGLVDRYGIKKVV